MWRSGPLPKHRRGFRIFQKTGQTVLFLNVGKSLAPAGEDLMRVGLVADVKNQFIVLFIEDIVERDREFNRPQIGGEMPSGFADVFNQNFLISSASSRNSLRDNSWRNSGDLISVIFIIKSFRANDKLHSSPKFFRRFSMIFLCIL